MIRVLLVALLVACVCQSHAQQLVDPTKPKIIPNQSESADGEQIDGFPQVKVSAIFINQEKRHAILNGQSVNEGDRWKGMLLAKVHQNGIVLVNNENVEKEFTINQNVKKDASHDF